MRIREQRILDKFDETELEYCRNMKPNDRESYYGYIRHNMNTYVSPSEWFKTIKKKENKIEKFISDTLGEKYIKEYNNLEQNDKVSYYTYLYRRVKYNRKDTEHLTPKRWFIHKEDNKLNMDFTEIAKELHLDDETVRKIYNTAIQKIRIFIMKNPKFKELEEYI